MSLFKKAKTKQKKETTKNNEKIRVNIDPSNFNKIKKLEELNNNLKRDKAKADLIASELKEIGKDEWVNLIKESKKNPGSFMLVSQNGVETAQVMFLPNDKYIKIDEERAEELSEEYGESIVTEDTSFGFNPSMLEKYGEVISELIENCPDIPEADKEKIIVAKTRWSIAKGTVDTLPTYKDVESVITDIQPICALKGPEVIVD